MNIKFANFFYTCCRAVHLTLLGIADLVLVLINHLVTYTKRTMGGLNVSKYCIFRP